MITYKGTSYDSKAAVVRAMFLAGDIDNSSEQKKRVAILLGMTVQTVHATLVKMNVKPTLTVPAPKTPVIPTPKKFVDSYADVRRLVEERYNECYEIAKTKGYDLPKIDIEWNLKGTVAGMFCNKFARKFFRVNLELAKHNMTEYLKQTVPHEFCHYVVRVQALKSFVRAKPHGWEWKNAMVNIFGLDPLRCHSYDTSNVRQSHSKPYVYKCNCQEHNITRLLHNRMLKGQTRRCILCKARISFVRMA